MTYSLISAIAGIRFALELCLAVCFNISPIPLRLGFKGSPPASVQAGLLISPHTQTWAVTPCMTHVAPKNVHFNSTLAKRDGSISCGHGENLEEDVRSLWYTKGPWMALREIPVWLTLPAFIVISQSEWEYMLNPHTFTLPFTLTLSDFIGECSRCEWYIDPYLYTSTESCPIQAVHVNSTTGALKGFSSCLRAPPSQERQVKDFMFPFQVLPTSLGFLKLKFSETFRSSSPSLTV